MHFFSFVSAGVYYLKIEGDAYGNPANGSSSPWDNPYYFNISSSPLSIDEALFNKKSVLKITDMLPYRRNTPLFYIYDDGTVRKE